MIKWDVYEAPSHNLIFLHDCGVEYNFTNFSNPAKHELGRICFKNYYYSEFIENSHNFRYFNNYNALQWK